jgi:hypothetical protein
MFSFEEYIMGWGIYLFSVIALLAVFWKMTRFITWGYIKDCIRLFAAVFLLLPITIESGSYYWAPAWIKALLNIIFSNLDVFWPIARLFLIVLCSTYLIYFILSFFISLINKLRTSGVPTKVSSKASSQERQEPHIV